MVKQRLPQSVTDSREMDFVERVEKDNLQTLSLDELANRFEEIEQQGQLFQGRILLEARERFKQDVEFGRWCSQTLCLASQPHRTRLMNLARFFNETNRPLQKISVTAAYEISAPINADIAVEVYELARGRNLSVAEVKKQIEIRKKSTHTEQRVQKTEENEHVEIEIIPIKLEKTKQDLIMDILIGLPEGEKANILRECLRNISLYPNR